MRISYDMQLKQVLANGKTGALNASALRCASIRGGTLAHGGVSLCRLSEAYSFFGQGHTL